MTLRLSAIAMAFIVACTPVLPSLAHEGHNHAATEAGHAGPMVTLGSLEISGGFTRATLPNAPVGGGFLSITNKGAEGDRLIAASAAIARETQIHEMAMEGDVMKMRELADGLELPAGETVALEPGGFHLMFMGLNGAIKEGDVIPVTLTFEKAGTVTVELVAAGSAADASAEHHSEMDHGSTIDQTGLGDVEAIAAMQKAMFDRPENPLAMGPITVVGDYAITGWAQGGMGGRALLRKTGDGWAIHLCAGAGLKDAAELVKIGVPEAVATDLAAAEAQLPAATVTLYDAFEGTMMVDEALI